MKNTGEHRKLTPVKKNHPNSDHPTRWEYYRMKQFGQYLIWAKQNSILHEPDNHVNRAKMDSMTQKLLDYKKNSIDLLSPHDQNCIDYPEITITNWTL